jgi:3D (Asp-Asp-Asp) domain-containing protein
MRDCARSGWVFAILAIAGMAYSGKQDSTDIKTEIRVERKEIPTTVEYQFSRSVGRGRLVKAEPGKVGQLIRTYKLAFAGGKLLSKELVQTERIEPKPTVFFMGQSGFVPNRHKFSRSRVIDMQATAYPPNPGNPRSSRPSHTATGRPACYGLVAVDPRVIPLGTHLYVEGYGFALAADTGGAIKGNRIDLCMANNSLCNQFGRRRVRVHILKS